MKSGSWSSYLAACPELRGEPDDDRRPCRPKCDRCGRFVSTKPGSGYREDHHPRGLTSDERAELLCAGCATVTPLPPTAEQQAEWDRQTIEAMDAAQREVWEREAVALAGNCDHCGTPLPAGRVGICRACELAAYPDVADYSSDSIPW